jgi:hypothetical protein
LVGQDIKIRPEWIFNAKWCEGRPWLKYDRDENAMTLALELELEIEREFI